MLKIIRLINELQNEAKLLETKFQQAKDILEELTTTESNLTHLLTELSGQETTVLKLLAGGESVSAIAEKLKVSKRTVQAHRWNIQKKLKLDHASDLKKVVIPWLKAH